MATQTDIDILDAVIQELVSGKLVSSCSIGDKAYQFTEAKLPEARKLLADMRAEVGMAAGTYSPRTYAKNGGRGI
jgi:hypothetical protein